MPAGEQTGAVLSVWSRSSCLGEHLLNKYSFARSVCKPLSVVDTLLYSVPVAPLALLALRSYTEEVFSHPANGAMNTALTTYSPSRFYDPSLSVQSAVKQHWPTVTSFPRVLHVSFKAINADGHAGKLANARFEVCSWNKDKTRVLHSSACAGARDAACGRGWRTDDEDERWMEREVAREIRMAQLSHR
jgi:hypothetical protein